MKKHSPHAPRLQEENVASLIHMELDRSLPWKRENMEEEGEKEITIYLHMYVQAACMYKQCMLIIFWVYEYERGPIYTIHDSLH